MKGGPGNRPSSLFSHEWHLRLHLSRRIGHTSGNGLWPGSRRRHREGSGERRRPELRPRLNRGRPLDECGSKQLLGDVRGRHFTSVVAPEDSRRARELFSQKVLGTSPATEATGVLVTTVGTRVAVELSAVPLMSGERVVGVFGLIEERPDDSALSAAATPHPPSSRGTPSPGAGPFDEADRRRAPPEPGDGQEPHPPSLPGPRRQLPT